MTSASRWGENATRRGVLKAGFEHTGTHMDAPLHFSADGHSIDMLPIDDLVAPLAVIDISQRAQDNPDSAVTPDDIKAWHAKNGPLPEGCCVAMHSSCGKLLISPRFAGRDSAGKNHTPGFHGETSHMLMSERNVKGIGVDTLSLDTGTAGASTDVWRDYLQAAKRLMESPDAKFLRRSLSPDEAWRRPLKGPRKFKSLRLRAALSAGPLPGSHKARGAQIRLAAERLDRFRCGESSCVIGGLRSAEARGYFSTRAARC